MTRVADRSVEPHLLDRADAGIVVRPRACCTPVFMTADDKRTLLLAISSHERRVAALKLKLMAAAADVADEDGARDVAAWLAPRTHIWAACHTRVSRLA